MKASGELHALTTLFPRIAMNEWQDWSWSHSEHDT